VTLAALAWTLALALTVALAMTMALMRLLVRLSVRVGKHALERLFGAPIQLFVAYIRIRLALSHVCGICGVGTCTKVILPEAGRVWR